MCFSEPLKKYYSSREARSRLRRSSRKWFTIPRRVSGLAHVVVHVSQICGDLWDICQLTSFVVPEWAAVISQDRCKRLVICQYMAISTLQKMLKTSNGSIHRQDTSFTGAVLRFRGISFWENGGIGEIGAQFSVICWRRVAPKAEIDPLIMGSGCAFGMRYVGSVTSAIAWFAALKGRVKAGVQSMVTTSFLGPLRMSVSGSSSWAHSGINRPLK